MRRYGRLGALGSSAAAVGVVAIALLSLGSAAFAQTAPPNPAALTGMKAPSLSGPNLAGKGQVDLTKYLGKPVVVVFWLNTCPHCQRDLPKINAYQQRLGKHAQIISAAMSSSMRGRKGFETPQAAIKTMHLTIPTVLYSSNAALNAPPGQWSVSSTPTAYVIDRAGTIRVVLQPDGNGEVTVKAINGALAEIDCGCALKSGPGVP